MRFDVIGFGALNVDKLFGVNRIAGAEEESFIETQSETPGGSAANTIVALARLGCKVGFIGKVGNDFEGRMLKKDLQNEGVDVSGIVRSKTGKSGSVMGFVDKQGARALYIDSGSNDTIDLSNISSEYVSQARYLHLTSFVGERSFQAQKGLVQHLPDDIRLSFDPGALYSAKGLSHLETIVKRTFVLMPNAHELELMTGESDFVKGADYLLGKGVPIVAVKLGEKGCYVTDGTERLSIEAMNVRVIDTTGAGDAFCAGFLYGLLMKKKLFQCGNLGNFVASRCIMKMGARTNLPYLKDLNPS